MDIADYLKQGGQTAGRRQLWRLLRTIFKEDSNSDEVMGKVGTDIVSKSPHWSFARVTRNDLARLAQIALDDFADLCRWLIGQLYRSSKSSSSPLGATVVARCRNCGA
jgi:hypothetical protein